MGALPDQGSLADHPLPRILVELHKRRFDGILSLRRDRVEKRVLFQGGAPVMAESNAASESLTAQLVDAGLLEREQEARVARLVKEKGCPEGTALLALKLIDPKGLFGALQQQLRRRIHACFEWASGEFSLETGGSVPEEARALRCDPLRLTIDGLVRHWGVTRLAAELSPELSRFPVRQPGFEALARRLPDDDVVRSGVAALDGTRSLGQALGASATQPALLAAVWLLASAGAIGFQDHPLEGDAAGAAGDAEIEIEITGAGPGAERPVGAAGPSHSATGGARAGAAEAGSGGGLSPAAESLRDEILSRHGQLPDLDYYQILGVAPDTAGPAIKKAYIKAAKKFHPDSLARMGLGGIRGEAGELFARISEAYEVLQDADERARYDARLAGGGDEADAQRLAQAETFYVKASFLMKMGNFREAFPLLESAVELWPDEAAYQSDLAWALFKKAPSEPERAVEHIEIAARLKPDDPEIEFRTGIVRRALERSK